MDSRCLFCMAVLALAATGAISEPVADPNLYVRALWRLEHDFVTWAELQETGARKGVSAANAGRGPKGYLDRLEALEGEIRALPAGEVMDLERKLRSVRWRIESWRGLDAATIVGGTSARFPSRGRHSRIRPQVPATECEGAHSLSEETVFWATTDVPRTESPWLTSWFSLSRLPFGWYQISTEGSTVDTVVTVLTGCGGEVLAVQDDGFGLQAKLAFLRDEGSDLILKLEALNPESQQDLFLALERTGSGGITGVVRDESTGSPVSSVHLGLYDSGGLLQSVDYTATNGSYSFDGLDPGSYLLATRHTHDYLDELWDDNSCEGGCDVTTGDLVAVEDSTVAGIDFDLSPGAALSGTVIETGGNLVTEGRIKLYGQSGERIDSRYLDPFGRFRFQGLTAGTYYLVTDLDGFLNEIWDDIPCAVQCDPLIGTPIALQDGQIAAGLDFLVEGLGTISGQLTDAFSGAPIHNGRVGMRRDPEPGWWSSYSDITGNWSSPGLPPGNYFVYTDLGRRYRNEVYDNVPCQPDCDPLQGNQVTLALGEDIAGIDFGLDLLGAISGSVTDQMTALTLESIRVEAWTDAGSLEGSGNSSALGRYEITDLFPDIYFVATDERGPYVDELFQDISCFGGPPSGCDPTTGTPVPIELGQLRDDVDFELSFGGILRGRVSDAATGDRLADARVEIYRSSGTLVESVSAESDGSFTSEGLPADQYYLATVSDSHFDQLWNGLDCEGGCNPLDGTPVLLPLGGVVEGLEFHLALQGGLSGSVTSEGAPLSGVIVHLWSDLGEMIAADVSDLGGFYQIDLSSGSFFLSTDAPDGYINEIWSEIACPAGPASDGFCDPLTGDEITIVGAEPVLTGYDLELDRVLFADGFESGDLAAWSDTSP